MPARLRSLVLLVPLAAACGGDARPTATDAVGAPTASAPGKRGNESGCADDDQAPAGAVCVQSVRGTVLDTRGDSVSAVVSLCGLGLCFGGTIEDGLFTIPVGRHVDLASFSVHVAGRPRHGDVFFPVDAAPAAVVDLDEPVRVAVLEHEGPALPELASDAAALTAGPVTVTLAPGTRAYVPPADQTPEGLHFRSGSVPERERWGEGLVALHTLAPFGTHLSARATVEISLASAVPDGTSLELVVLDEDLSGPRPGKIVGVGSATVTGGVARSDAGAGLDRLTWVGLRAKTAP